jgi:hypothetical protein
MAPEVVSRKGHSFAADWWSYGVLMVGNSSRCRNIIIVIKFSLNRVMYNFPVRNADWNAPISS